MVNLLSIRILVNREYENMQPFLLPSYIFQFHFLTLILILIHQNL